MNINGYLQNPYGKGAAFPGANTKELYRKMHEKYLTLQKRFSHRIYIYHDNAIIHVVVPGSDPNVSYDVVMEFKLNDLVKEAISIGELPFTVFSNCPSFIFTYANAFRNANLTCQWLDTKLSKKARTTSAATRNQFGVIGYEKSIYLACIHIKHSGAHLVSVIHGSSEKVTSYSRIARTVRTQDEILDHIKAKAPHGNTPKTTGSTFDTKKSESHITQRKGATPSTKPALFTRSTKTNKKVKATRSAKTTKKV
ncbi:MAG: hypothetical protein NC548_05425 [Lachnospiraceae bacterium]|nr:hypothetical protein [Lachnospiraceae bacterium]